MSRCSALSRAELAVLVPELLLIGQLIDRSGMAWCIASFGREAMLQIAIEEWAGSSPIYTRRMQKALYYEGDDVVTIFKGLQLDIGAPPPRDSSGPVPRWRTPWKCRSPRSVAVRRSSSNPAARCR